MEQMLCTTNGAVVTAGLLVMLAANWNRHPSVMAGDTFLKAIVSEETVHDVPRIE